MKKLASISFLSIATLLLAAVAVGSSYNSGVVPDKGITLQADGSPLPPPLPRSGPGALA